MKIRVITIEPKDVEKMGVTLTAGYAFAHRYHWRVRLGLFLFRLGAFVSSIGLNEEVEP